MKMDFDTGCLLKYQVYCFRYLYLIKFFVEQLPLLALERWWFRRPVCDIHYGLSTSPGGLC